MVDRGQELVNRMRAMVWCLLLPGPSKGLRVLGKIWVDPVYNLFVGENVVLNEGVYINARAKVFIGDNVHLSSHVIIHAGSLDLTRADRPHQAQSVVIEEGVWVASGVIINPGVTIHQGAVVGAGAVVTSDIPAYTLCAGVPARVIRTLQKGS